MGVVFGETFDDFLQDSTAATKLDHHYLSFDSAHSTGSANVQSNAEYDIAINQAAGMVSAQLAGIVAQALIHMRAQNFSIEPP